VTPNTIAAVAGAGYEARSHIANDLMRGGTLFLSRPTDGDEIGDGNTERTDHWEGIQRAGP